MTIRAFQIFQAGTWNSQSGPVTIDQAAVRQVAAGYSRDLRAAKLVLGHPDVETDAYGEVKSLTEMDGGLYAFADVDESLIDAVRAKRYKNVSASIYMPETPGNPRPGAYYLRHVGFLGAAPPAVKNMQPLSFAEPDAAAGNGPANFAIPAGCHVDQGRIQLYTLARDMQHANPAISFIQAAILAQNAMQR
ncbi:TPA: hypothetical protein UMZ03_001805 [Stenotrophomonas maltophilia]|uniref:hypothetical protein n=1 Tax=Stenotrophomonas maltophilia TaxID=40324 RepID=UPI0018D35D7C|nr:hypothetical protein [Stenotrophomonas maltophilia]MBH1594970.1 hypothetical protein [Stenotrophomonas maltophilia]HEL3240990.1 hypothetical protein [Stenotrophomonas maltophilia]HEL3851081.1 hypothetical protein [Stenotrophomonas maltophilia]HEL4773379.1 hypothetical protein [Stenotrophomonas maltophilia]